MKIVKNAVGTATRKLSANYTVDYSQEIEHILGEELRRAIDDEIMDTVAGPYFTDEGWTRVVVPAVNAQVPTAWCQDYIRDEYRCFGHYWYFKSSADAVLFTLRWL